jgi:hypothetical protein
MLAGQTKLRRKDNYKFQDGIMWRKLKFMRLAAIDGRIINGRTQ